MQCINKKCDAELVEGAAFCHTCGKKQISTERTSIKRGNGQGSVYKLGTGYVASVVKYYYFDENGKRKPKRVKKEGFKTKKEALEFLPNLRAAKEKKIPTLEDLWRAYEISALLTLSRNKQVSYKIAKKKLTDIFHVPIDTLTIEDLQKVIDDSAETHYPARDMKTVLSHLYKRAMAQGDVVTNLSQFIVLPKLGESNAAPFTKDEQNALWKAYTNGDSFAMYILLMIYTGMMPGELLTAKKEYIDWKKKEIIGGGLKTDKRKKTPIALPDIIIPVLQRICDASNGDKLIHISEDKFYSEFYSCLERAGCDKKPPYSCRHTTGTALGTSDIPLAIVKEVMRHSKITTTEKYIHVDMEEVHKAINRKHNAPTPLVGESLAV